MKKACGLDVHKDSVFVCILSKNGEKIQERFGEICHHGFIERTDFSD
jgi:hypothetical protein